MWQGKDRAVDAIRWVGQQFSLLGLLPTPDACNDSNRLLAAVEGENPDMTLDEMIIMASEREGLSRALVQVHMREEIASGFSKPFLMSIAMAVASHRRSASVLIEVYGQSLPFKVRDVALKHYSPLLLGKMPEDRKRVWR